MVEADGGEFSTLTLKYHLGSDPEFPEILPNLHVDLARVLQAGSRIRLIDRTNKDKEWFVGYVGQDATLVQGSPQGESFQVSVYGPEWLLAGKVVKGAWYEGRKMVEKLLAAPLTSVFGGGSYDLNSGITSGNVVEPTDRPAVFNDGGPNMGNVPFEYGNTSAGLDIGRAFTTTNWRGTRNGVTVAEANQWTAIAALYSTLVWFDNDNTISRDETDWFSIHAVLGTVTIGEVSIDGLTLTDAIQAILGPLGYGWRLNVVSDGANKHALTVYPLVGAVAGKQPYLPPIGAKATDAQGSRGEVSRLDFLRDSHNIRNEVAVYGNQGMVQVTLTYKSSQTETDLFPAWSNDSNPIDIFFVDGSFKAVQAPNKFTLVDNYHSSGDNFLRNAWRTFIFNEDAGGLDFAIYEDDGIPDLTKYGLGDALYKRPIQRLLQLDEMNDFKRPVVKMIVTTNGVPFEIDVSEHFEILTDRAGIRLRTDMFTLSDGTITGAWFPFAQKVGSTEEKTAAEKALGNLPYLDMLNNALWGAGDEELILQVTGTMERDTAVKGEVPRVTSSPLNLTRERLVRNRSLNNWSVVGAAEGNVDTRDDSDAALAMAKAIQFADDSEIGHGSLMFHHATQAYPPGSVIAQTSGRVLNLRLDGQRKNAAPVVRRTTHHFGQTNVTEVLLDSPLLRLT